MKYITVILLILILMALAKIYENTLIPESERAQLFEQKKQGEEEKQTAERIKKENENKLMSMDWGAVPHDQKLVWIFLKFTNSVYYWIITSLLISSAVFVLYKRRMSRAI